MGYKDKPEVMQEILIDFTNCNKANEGASIANFLSINLIKPHAVPSKMKIHLRKQIHLQFDQVEGSRSQAKAIDHHYQSSERGKSRVDSVVTP